MLGNKLLIVNNNNLQQIAKIMSIANCNWLNVSVDRYLAILPLIKSRQFV